MMLGWGGGLMPTSRFKALMPAPWEGHSGRAPGQSPAPSTCCGVLTGPEGPVQPGSPGRHV